MKWILDLLGPIVWFLAQLFRRDQKGKESRREGKRGEERAEKEKRGEGKQGEKYKHGKEKRSLGTERKYGTRRAKNMS